MARDQKIQTIAWANDYPSVSAMPSMMALPNTDVIYPEVLLYIEGVQVPFTSISLSTSYRGMPEATIGIPFYPGLTEIAKGYFPKVHIFFKDTAAEKFLLNVATSLQGDPDRVDQKEMRRLLFSGVIIGYDYSKRKTVDSGETSIQFRCVHKYYALKELIMKFGARGVEQVLASGNDEGEVAKMTSVNSAHGMLQVLGGISEPTTKDKPVTSTYDKDASVAHLQAELQPYYSRLQGMTGVAVALWNLIKRDSSAFADRSRMLTDIYIPLMDDGLRFCRRLSGHPTVEGPVQEKKQSVNLSELMKRMKQEVSKEDNRDQTESLLVSPALSTFIGEAAALDIAFVLMQSGFQNSGEMTDYLGMITGIYNTMKYDLEILTSPVQCLNQATGEPIESVDAVVKPLLPFYYSPMCNVVLPCMYDSLTLRDLTYQVPTRVLATGKMGTINNSNLRELEYRAPHEVRSAIANMAPDSSGLLADTRMKLGEYPGVHEYGRGVKLKKIPIDRWVSFLLSSYSSEASSSDPKGTGYVTTGSKYYTRKIRPENSPVENSNNPELVWKYWDKQKPIPAYNLSGGKIVRGYDMEYGVPGKLTSGTVYNDIQTFRATTLVPKHWNVIYFPASDSYAVNPPHYDYVRDEWWMTKEMFKEHEKTPFYNLTRDYASASSLVVEKEKTTNVVDAAPNSGSGGSTLLRLRQAWDNDYPGQEPLNPYGALDITGIQPYEISLFALIDYEYSLALMETRVGNVDGPFNPYIIPGYPMDIIDASTDGPSIHAFCTSVNHSITGSSIQTSVSFTSGITYDEMRSYELPAILPWFRDQLGMLDTLTLLDQPESTRTLANEYYMKTLGVGFADPSLLEDKDSGAANSVLVDKVTGAFILDQTNVFLDKEQQNSLSDQLMKYGNPNFTYEGNLNLVRREIESMADIEQFSGIKFIDIVSRPSLSPQERVKVSAEYRTVQLKPGRSAFIDYSDAEQVLKSNAKTIVNSVNR